MHGHEKEVSRKVRMMFSMACDDIPRVVERKRCFKEHVRCSMSLLTEPGGLSVWRNKELKTLHYMLNSVGYQDLCVVRSNKVRIANFTMVL